MPTYTKRRSRTEIILIGLAILGLVLLGSILLVDEVKSMLLKALLSVLAFGVQIFNSIPGDVWRILIGAAVVAGGYALAREGFLALIPRIKAETCPRCAHHLRHVHRTWLDKLIGFILIGHLVRYKCFDCDWTGLRRQHHHKHRPGRHHKKAQSF